MSEPTPKLPAIPPELRRDYAQGSLLESEAADDPIVQFARWFDDAARSGMIDANAMNLATVDAAGQPSSRIVLLKSFNDRGFMFFTNYDSRKGRELEANLRVALCFHWKRLERQVRIEGTVEKTSREVSEQYFHSRPVAAQISAWVSHQSETIQSREELDAKAAELAKKFEGAPVPLPPYWGGYLVAPSVIEFWQGRVSRLHDRLEYRRDASGAWQRRRLSP